MYLQGMGFRLLFSIVISTWFMINYSISGLLHDDAEDNILHEIYAELGIPKSVPIRNLMPTEFPLVITKFESKYDRLKNKYVTLDATWTVKYNQLAANWSTMYTKYNTLEEEFSDCRWMMAARQIVDLYENEFVRYEYSYDIDDRKEFTPTVQKFQRDNALIKKIAGFYERVEEVRRQKWVHYLENPPTSLVENLFKVVQQQSNILDFAAGIAKAYRRLSEEFHSAVWKGSKTPKNVYIDIIHQSNNALTLLLSTVDLNKKLFSYEEVEESKNSDSTTHNNAK